MGSQEDSSQRSSPLPCGGNQGTVGPGDLPRATLRGAAPPGPSQVGRPPEPELQPAGPPALQCTSPAHGLGEAAGNRVSAYGAEGAPGSQAGSGGPSGSKGRVTRPPCRIHLSSPWESPGSVIFQTTGEAAGVCVLHSALGLGTDSFLSESRSLLKEDACRFPPSVGGAGGCRRGTVWRGARSPVSSGASSSNRRAVWGSHTAGPAWC